MNLKIVLVSFVVTAGFAERALPCDPQQKMKVVGFSADNKKTLMRSEDDRGGIKIIVVDLATGKETERHEILTLEEAETSATDAARAQLRGKRWKEAEAKLTKQGFKFMPNYAPLKGTELIKGVTLEYATEKDEEASFYGTGLLAKKGAKSVTLIDGKKYLAPSSDTMSISDLYKSPDGKYLITSHEGCFENIFVFDIAKVTAGL